MVVSLFFFNKPVLLLHFILSSENISPPACSLCAPSRTSGRPHADPAQPGSQNAPVLARARADACSERCEDGTHVRKAVHCQSGGPRGRGRGNGAEARLSDGRGEWELGRRYVTYAVFSSARRACSVRVRSCCSSAHFCFVFILTLSRDHITQFGAEDAVGQISRGTQGEGVWIVLC